MMFLANETVGREWLADASDTREIFDLHSDMAFGWPDTLDRLARTLSNIENFAVI